MRIGSLLILLCIYASGFTQSTDFPRDTSYSIHSAYLKIKKNYPKVTPVIPNHFDGVSENYNVIYTKYHRELTLDVFYPKSKTAERRPAVILVYGGGWSSGEKTNQVPLAIELAANNYVAIVPEYRLSPEAKYPAAVDDLRATIKWAVENSKSYQIDTNRLVMLGASAGAQLATLVGVTKEINSLGGANITEQYGEIAAIVNIDGIVAFIHPESEEGTYAAKWLGGTKEEVPEIWNEASALTYVNDKTPPTLFINSSHPRFHAGRDDMIDILNKYDIYSEVHTLKDSPHSFWHVNPWFIPTRDITVAFLNKIFNYNN